MAARSAAPQVTQAEACGIAPHVDMNPVLLKPESDGRSQVIVSGQPLATLPATQYYLHKDDLWGVVTAALERLRQAYDLVLIEGAGSPAELNLRRGDIVNMALALHAGSPVLLAGDIDKGGIFAQLLGTLWLLEPPERALVRGLIVNKFRGDPRSIYRGRSHPAGTLGPARGRRRALAGRSRPARRGRRRPG